MARNRRRSAIAAAAKLVAMLIMAIAHYTGFAVPKAQPELRFLPADELQHRFCGLPCPIRAFFPPGTTIYLEQGLDVFHNPASESILVHELTHWMQQANLPIPSPGTATNGSTASIRPSTCNIVGFGT